MESKKIISMLAMAAVMVGCSQDELVEGDALQNAAVDLSGRPAIEDVVLGIGVDSRMAIAEGSAIQAAYEEGDQIGACIIDIPAYDNKVQGEKYEWSWTQYVNGEGQGSPKVSFAGDNADAKGFYAIQEHISTNYPFTRSEDENFYTNAELVEGNYMFYLPYAESHRTRERLNVVLPQVQDCSDEVMRPTIKGGQNGYLTSSTALDQFFGGEMEGFEGALAVVGYQFLSKDNAKPQVTMEPIFAYPLITIENNFNSFVYGATKTTTATAPETATMVIDSVHIYYDGVGENPLFLKSAVNSSKIATEMGGEKTWCSDRFGANGTGAYTAEVLDENKTIQKHDNPVTELPKINANVSEGNKFEYISENRVTLVLGKELESGASYSFHAVLPAANYGHDLKARVYATINGKACVISDITNKPNLNKDDKIVSYSCSGFAGEKDYRFQDAAHGDENLELLRGEQYPKAEYIIKDGDATGMKAFSGDMMTISLESTVDADGVVKGATAFELVEIDNTVTPDPSETGILNNEDFIAYMNSYLQNGVAMEEDADLATTPKNEWPAGKLAFATDNTVVIDAALVEEIHAQMNIDGDKPLALTLTSTQLGIGNDVKMEEGADGLYTFTTLDGKYGIKIQYTGVEFNGSNPLLTGINKITVNQTNALTVKTGESNAVVYVSANAKYTGAEGINAIYLTAGTLTVDAACDVMIIATGGNIVIGENGSLTNANNNIAAAVTITNNYENEIVGTLADGVVVEATYTAWPTTAIAANSKINEVVVNPAIEVEAIAIEQAQIDKLANLTNVNVVLGENVSGEIISTADVTLNNVSTMVANNVMTWKTTNTAGITLNSSADVTLVNIELATGVKKGDKVAVGTTSDALNANKKDIYVALNEDITLDIDSYSEVMGGENTETITIDAKGKKITFNNLHTENNVVKTANNAKLVIKNATLTNTGKVGGTWNTHDLAFACDVELINVVSEKAIAFKADAELNNVTINDANTTATYAIWISALGQTVSLDNCTIDMLACSNGRGIKIDEQYVDAADVKKVTLNVSNTSFKTEEKAAIMVKSKAGADINLSNVDITGVAADTNNAVWVDEDSKEYASLVKVNGGSVVVE